MTTTQVLWMLLAIGWISLEIAVVRRSSDGQPHELDNPDRGSAGLLWLICGVSVVLALAFKEWRAFPLPLIAETRQGIALLVFAAGVGLRVAAMVCLGRLFTVHIKVQEGHTLIAMGPYRWIRHPSYTGLLLAFTGAGIAMGDWLALASLLFPVAVAVLHRIRLEEIMLGEHFPTEYPEYCRVTSKLLPGIY